MGQLASCIPQDPQPRRFKTTDQHLPASLARPLLEQAVSRAFMVDSAELWSVTRGCPRAAFARQVAMYLAHIAWGLTLTQVGQVFTRDRTTVAHACSLIEDLRDDRVLDRSLELLEGALRASPPASTAGGAGIGPRS